jgi:hypothetical protein
LELEGTKLGAQIEKDKDTADRKENYDGTKLGIDMAKSKEQQKIEMMQMILNSTARGEKKGE